MAESPSTAKFLVRHYVELFTALAVLFVLQAGLIPFDFLGGQAGTGSTEFFRTDVSRLTSPDIVSNIFLYVPVGMLLHWTLSRGKRSRTLILPVTIILAAALSGGIEWIQAYSPVRVSSLIDLISNVAGATLGASLSWIARWLVPGMVDAALIEFQKRPQAAFWKTYCVVLIIFAIIPFSFSFDPGRLKQAVKSANFIPFVTNEAHDAWGRTIVETNDSLGASYAKWRSMKRWSRWEAELMSFAVLAWILQAFLRDDYKFGHKASMALAWWLGGALAIALSILQIPIMSRTCDVTDILFRLFGFLLGLITRSIVLRDLKRLEPALHALRWQRLARIGCAATVGYIIYAGVIPLTFAADTGGPMASLTSKGFLPFFSYFVTRFDLMMADVMEKFASYAVFAALLALCWTHTGALDSKPRLFAITAVGVGISTVIEIVQMFIPVRVTSLTDLVLASVGCVTGVVTQQWIVGTYRLAKARTAPGEKQVERAPTRTLHLAPSDALVATLMEPHADAPQEPSPTPASKTRP